ncbi:MAG: CRISPR-associated endonuclease Cas2 [Minisyncoccia bacterium]
MPGAEEKIRKQIRNSKIQKAVLSSLYLAGILTVAAVAPNVLSLLKHLDPDKKRKSSQKYSINTAIKRLSDKGLVMWKKNEEGTFLRLTKQGEKTIEFLEKREFKFDTPKKWDKKWRIVIFDIREKRKGTREKFRKILMQVGFIKLQNSVWVYPYPCEELVTFLKADFKIGKEILYIIADSIENDRWVKKYFEL